MKKIFILTLLILAISCTSDDEIETTITVDDFTITIDENPDINQLLGNINATTNQGSLNYSIISQSNTEALSIDEVSGELTITNVTVFDFETNPIITAIVEVTNNNISATSNVTINLNDINLPLTNFIIAGDTNPDNVNLTPIVTIDYDNFGELFTSNIDIDSDGIVDILIHKQNEFLINRHNFIIINNYDTNNIEISYSQSYLEYVNEQYLILNNQMTSPNSPCDISDILPYPSTINWVHSYNNNDLINNDQDWSNQDTIFIHNHQVTAGGECIYYDLKSLENNGFIGFRKTTDNGIIYGWINADFTFFASNNITE